MNLPKRLEKLKSRSKPFEKNGEFENKEQNAGKKLDNHSKETRAFKS